MYLPYAVGRAGLAGGQCESRAQFVQKRRRLTQRVASRLIATELR